MKRFFTGKVKLILVLALALAIIAAVVGAVVGGASFGQKVMGVVLSPFRAGVAAITRQVEQTYDYMFRYEALEQENTALKEKIASMESDIRTAQTLRRENERLTSLLKLTEQHEDFQYVSTYVTSWESSNWRSACTLSKGSGAGLREGMCAVTEFGQVVGVVTAVGPSWATVTTIMDPAMEVSASITSLGYTGVVQGSYEKDGTLRMNYLPTDAVVKNNDQVVTTGSTLYPKGLILGYVTDAGMDETGVGKFAMLSPAADFDNMEQLFVITEYQN